MKIQKGTAGYISAKKRQLALHIGVIALIAIVLIVTGYSIYETKLNWCSVLAVLICIPVCRTIVNLIMLLPYTSMTERDEMEISGLTEDLTVLYDLIVTSEKKAMKIDAIAITKNTVCGYAKSSKVDTEYAAKHIKNMLEENGLEKITVKIFKDYVAFLSRAEGMQNMASVAKEDNKNREEFIAQIILDISI